VRRKRIGRSEHEALAAASIAAYDVDRGFGSVAELSEEIQQELAAVLVPVIDWKAVKAEKRRRSFCVRR
jgi:hypothetical protein